MNQHSLHPRFRKRLDQIEHARSLGEDRTYFQQIEAIERDCARFADGRTAPLAEAVRDTCAVLRQSMATHPAGTVSGRLIRKFIPDRIRELETVCRATEPDPAPRLQVVDLREFQG